MNFMYAWANYYDVDLRKRNDITRGCTLIHRGTKEHSFAGRSGFASHRQQLNRLLRYKL